MIDLRRFTIGYVRVLRHLRAGEAVHGEGACMKDVATLNGFSRPAATVLSDQLVKLGLVSSRPHPFDRRKRMIFLTEAGRAGLEEIEAILSE